MLIPLVERVTQRAADVARDARGAARVEAPVLLRGKLFAQRPSFDEFHDDVVVVLRLRRLVDRRDVRMVHRRAELALAFKLVDRRFVVPKARPENLYRDDLPRVFMDAAEDARKRSRPDEILDDVRSVAVARRFALRKAFDLEFRQIPASQRLLKKLFRRENTGAKGVLEIAKLAEVEQIER